MRAPSSTFVVIGRLVLLCGAGLALIGGLALSRARDRREAAAQVSSERYVCPMHPEVVAHAPGECPICRMELERVTGDSVRAAIAADGNLVNVVKRRVVSQLIRAPAWLDANGAVMAVLHKDDLVGLPAGSPAKFFGTQTSRAGLEVRLSAGEAAPWDASTAKVRFIAAKAAPTKVGVTTDTGWLDIAARPRELLVVPSNAVLYTAEGPYVVAVSTDGQGFSKRPVEIGRILDSGYVAELSKDRFGAIVVLSGLRENDRVVVEDTFFLDAERRLQEGRGMGPEVMQ
jgi:hypothetical protein